MSDIAEATLTESTNVEKSAINEISSFRTILPQVLFFY